MSRDPGASAALDPVRGKAVVVMGEAQDMAEIQAKAERIMADINTAAGPNPTDRDLMEAVVVMLATAFVALDRTHERLSALEGDAK